ncbi:TPA: hypothetical protein DCZ39_04655 [Patescibacteria group bacterium]|nr:hypothetical protein [Candidatus Gracilibacteria bacterium]
MQMAPNHSVKSLAYKIHFFSVKFLLGTIFLYMIVDHQTKRLSTDDMMTAKIHANHTQINRLLGMISCINANIAVLGFIHFSRTEATNPRKITIPIRKTKKGSDR